MRRSTPTHLTRMLVIVGLTALCFVTLPGGCSKPTSSEPAPADARQVTLRTEDGLSLQGHLFGSGKRAVVLAHMYPADQTSWYTTAERLADEGFLVLTFDFRGYGRSQGSKEIGKLDLDIAAAVRVVIAEGASEVVLVGASMGGTASLKAADQLQQISSFRLAGVATLSAPVEFEGLSVDAIVPRLYIPMLFVAAEGDLGADEARRLQQAATKSSATVEIVEGSDHGTALLEGAQAERVWSLLLDFITTSMPA